MIQVLNDPFYYQNAAFLGRKHTLLYKHCFVNAKILF
jgi:hypothetical protein